MKDKNKIIDYLSKTQNPYKLKVDNMNIEIEYSENNKRLNECMQNILKQKVKRT